MSVDWEHALGPAPDEVKCKRCLHYESSHTRMTSQRLVLSKGCMHCDCNEFVT